MAIAVFDKFLNVIPSTIIDGKDVSQVILVDPPLGLPPIFLANKAALDTAAKELKIYGDDGTVADTLDLSSTDLTPVYEKIAEVEGIANKNAENIVALQSASGDNAKDISDLQASVVSMIADIGTNASDIEGLKTTTAKNASDITGLSTAVGNNATDIANLGKTVGNNETEISTLKQDVSDVTEIAIAADTLSKDNKTRLDNLPSPPDLSGYIKNGDNANLGTLEAKLVKFVNPNDSSKFSDIHVDTNNNTTFNTIGNFYVNMVNKETGNTDYHSMHIDGNGRVEFAQKIRTPLISNFGSWSSNTNTEGTAFIDLTGNNTVKLGAKSSVVFAVDGITTMGVYKDNVNFGNASYVTGVNMRPLEQRQDHDAVNWAEIKNIPTVDNIAKYDQLNSYRDAKDGDGIVHNNLTFADYYAGVGNNDEERLNNMLQFLAKGVDSYRNNSSYWSMFMTISSSVPSWGSEIFKRYGTWRFTRMATQGRNVMSFESNDRRHLYTANVSVDGVFDGWNSIAYEDNSVSFGKITAKGLDFTGTDATAKIVHDQIIDVVAEGTTNVAFKASGLKILKEVDVHGQALNFVGHINMDNNRKISGKDVGNLVIENLGVITRNHTNRANSIALNNGNNLYKSNSHVFTSNDDQSLLTISNASIDAHSHKIVNVANATNDTDVPNYSQVKASKGTNSAVVTGLDNLTVDGQTLQHWMDTMTGGNTDSYIFYNRIRRSRPVNDTSQQYYIANAHFGKDSSIFKFLPDDATVASGTMQIIHQGDTACKWFIYVGLSEFYMINLDFNFGTGNSGKPNTAFGKFVTGGGGGSGTGGSQFKEYINNVTGSPTYYEHQGKSHLYIDYTGAGGTVSIDSMRRGTEQEEDIFALHNKTPDSCSVRLFYEGSSVLYTVPAKSYITAWANRDMGRWVATLCKDPNYVPTQKVLSIYDISWSTSSDPRENTKRIVAAMPNYSILVGRHNPSSSDLRFKVVSRGNSSSLEAVDCSYVIEKNESGRWTGMSTTTNSNYVYSRVVDTRGVWNTNSTSNSRSVSSEIDLSQTPEGLTFLTGDLGIVETYLDEETDVIKLRQVDKYNIPKINDEVEELQVQNEMGKSKTYYFMNSTKLTYDWNNPENRPITEVYVLDSSQNLENTFVNLTDDETHKYTGKYNSVGSICIDTLGNWSNYSYHNAYKHEGASYYIVMNYGIMRWTIIEAANPHTSIGSQAAKASIELGERTQLPETYGNYIIDNNFEDIDSLEFIKAEVNVKYDDENSKVIIDFNGSNPSGYVIIK